MRSAALDCAVDEVVYLYGVLADVAGEQHEVDQRDLARAAIASGVGSS